MLNILCLSCLLGMTIQDFKERKVYLWLLLCTIAFMAYHFFYSVAATVFLINILINLSVILLIVGILYLYTHFKLKIKFYQALGFGDILFFLGISLSFPSVSFIFLFSFSLVFSALSYRALKPLLKTNNVPLAGLQALFFLLLFSVNWPLGFINLYRI